MIRINVIMICIILIIKCIIAVYRTNICVTGYFVKFYLAKSKRWLLNYNHTNLFDNIFEIIYI